MGGKRHVGDDTTIHPKRKKHKKAYAAMDQTSESEHSTFDTAELLDNENIREGMLLLGCVTAIKPTFLVMSLPGFLSGRVPLNNISSPFTKSLRDFATNAQIEESTLSSFVKTGMVFPCRVVQISKDSSKKRSSITLSINPADINIDLKPSLLYPKMVLYVSVSSIEDHGCIVDVGNKYIQGFLPKQYCQDYREEFKVGEVIPAFIKEISSDKTWAKIQLSPANLKKPFPTVSAENINLNSILPGAKILGDVIEIKHPFIYIKYLCFDACASVLSFGPAYTAIKVGKQVCGTVLYVHPITHMIYLTLNLKSSPEHFESYFGLRKYAVVNNLKYFCSYKKFAYYMINKGNLGFFHVKDLPKSVSNNTISKASVISCHYMDNLLQLSSKTSLLERKIIFPEDVQIGDKYDAVVSKHTHEGMFVKICPGLSGFVRRIHISDAFVTKPEVLHPVNSKVKCKVLSTDGRSKLLLTCKESLLKLPDQFILSSYNNVQKGQFYKGVIAHKTDTYILVLFFNDVKGIVQSSHVPKGSIFFEGQTVLCEVLHCDSLKKKLKLSLQTEDRYSVEDINDFWDELPRKIVSVKNNLLPHEGNLIQLINSENLASKTDNPDIQLLGASSLSNTNEEIMPEIPVKAVISSIKGNQLNIMINKTKGRVHVTELGSMSEGIYPLRKFSVGQEIQVYVFGEFTKKKKNYLKISHKNCIAFKECSLNFPSYSLSQDFSPGQSLIGFVKEVHDVSVYLWLTSTQIGVLDYLHFSENLKVVKSLHRSLKIGLSVKVSVLDNNAPIITLTKIEKVLLQSERNVIGLVQIPCSENGLVLKLPHGYHGSVAVTDLTDVYLQVPILFQKYRKCKFLLCHILEVNHQTKYCQLSLRKSRVYGKQNVSSTNFCPEITKDDIKVGNTIKGFVKTISDSAVIIILGRNLEGKIPIHTCSSPDCRMCEISKNIIDNYPVGSIAEVIIKECFEDGRSCILNLTDLAALKNEKSHRLDVVEDISWDEECEDD